MLRFVVDVAEKDAWCLHEPYRSKLKDALAWATRIVLAARQMPE